LSQKRVRPREHFVLEFGKNTTDRTAFYVLDVLPLELLARLRERQSYWGQATDTWTETNLMGV